MNIFWGILCLIAGLAMISAVFWLIRSGNSDGMRALTVIFAYTITILFSLSYLLLSIVLIARGIYLIFFA